MDHPLPLTDLAFNVLLALGEGERHGYALIKQLRELDGRERLRTGTVYAALARLVDQGWVAEADPPETETDDRRRYYRITDDGRAVARAEAVRLRGVLEMARRQDLLSEASGA